MGFHRAQPSARSPLLITAIWTAGQFTISPYLRPLLADLAGASPPVIAGFFASFGVMGMLGNVAATRVVARIGTYNTSLFFLVSLLVGMLVWALGAGSLAAMGVGVLFLGLGFAAFNSMQQARLVAAAPVLASATVALNTSFLYVGQAIGSGIGGAMLAHGQLVGMGYVGTAFMLVALGVLALTRQVDKA